MKVSTLITITARFKDSYARKKHHGKAMMNLGRFHTYTCDNRRCAKSESLEDRYGKLELYVTRHVSQSVPIADVARDVETEVLPEILESFEQHPFVEAIVEKTVTAESARV